MRDYGKLDRLEAPIDCMAAHLCGANGSTAQTRSRAGVVREAMMREIDHFLDSLAPGERDIANRLREIVSAVAPVVIEGFKWNAPSFIHGGDHKLTFGRKKDGGIRLVAHRGAKPRAADQLSFLDTGSLAEWQSADRGIMNFRSLEEVDRVAEQLQAFVSRWLEATR